MRNHAPNHVYFVLIFYEVKVEDDDDGAHHMTVFASSLTTIKLKTNRRVFFNFKHGKKLKPEDDRSINSELHGMYNRIIITILGNIVVSIIIRRSKIRKKLKRKWNTLSGLRTTIVVISYTFSVYI